MGSSRVMDSPLVRLTILDGARHHCDKHKWYLSEAAHCDVGVAAVEDWFDKHFPNYARERLIEHIHGRYLYEEFNQQAFNIVQVFTFRTPTLREQVVDLICKSKENLDVINWAMDHQKDVDEVIEFLTVIDVNSCRELARKLKPTLIAQTATA
jgi:hypothetical protein